MPGGVFGDSDISSWSGVIRGSESVSRGRLEGSCSPRISEALVMRCQGRAERERSYSRVEES